MTERTRHAIGLLTAFDSGEPDKIMKFMDSTSIQAQRTTPARREGMSREEIVTEIIKRIEQLRRQTYEELMAETHSKGVEAVCEEYDSVVNEVDSIINA